MTGNKNARLSVDELLKLPPTLAVWHDQPDPDGVPSYGELLGHSRAKAYASIHRGEVQWMRSGRKIKVLTLPLLRQLGVIESAAPRELEIQTIHGGPLAPMA